MSTVGMAVCRSAARHCAIVSRVITSRRSGPASTWQCRQVWLQSFPTLIWKIEIAVGPSGCSPSAASASENPRASGSRFSASNWARGAASGRRRAASEGRVVAMGRGPSHPPPPRVVAHLHPVHQRRPAPGWPTPRAPPRSSDRGPLPSRARRCCRRRCSTGTAWRGPQPAP